MELRNYLQVLRRRRSLIALMCLLGLALGAAAHFLRPSEFASTARLQLQPNNPNERITPDPGGFFDPERYAAAQVTAVTSSQVMQAAGMRLGVAQEDLRSAVSASASDGGGVLDVAARARTAERSSEIANVVADAYIAYNRDSDVRALNRAAAQIDLQLTGLRQEIADLQATRGPSGPGAALEAAGAQLTDLSTQRRLLLIDASLKSGRAQVARAATVPSNPTGVSLPVATLLGGLLGLMLGLGFAVFRDLLDDRLRSRSEVERLTGLPVLADLPVDQQSARQPTRIAMKDEPLGPLAEATRSLRTSITFLGVEAPVRRVVVTSAVAGEGKSLVAANLAVAFAQAGARTLLVSADLRRSRLEVALGFGNNSEGLSTVLAAPSAAAGRSAAADPDQENEVLRVALRAALRTTSVADLTFLPAGITPPNPAELLGSRRMDEVLLELDRLFDFVVLDATPMVPVTDAAALAGKAGQLLLVTSAGRSRRRSVQRMMDITRLTGANVLGVVFNRSKADSDLYAGYDSAQPAVTASRPAPHDSQERSAEAGGPQGEDLGRGSARIR